MNMIQQFSVDGEARIGVATQDVCGNEVRFFWWKNIAGTAAVVAKECGKIIALGYPAVVRSGLDLTSFYDDRRVVQVRNTYAIYVDEAQWTKIRSEANLGYLSVSLRDLGLQMAERRV